MATDLKTNPNEFKMFHELLTKSNPNFKPFYFPLMKEGKDPLEGISWKNNYKTFQEAYDMMERGYNIGIAATDVDKLCIVDVDDLSVIDTNQIKSTLKIKSRKQVGQHNYYFTDDSINPEDNISAKQNLATESAGEVRAVWQYVVAPGSFVPCSTEELSKIPEEDKEYAGQYRIQEKNDVAYITFNELPDAYKEIAISKKERNITSKIKSNTNTPSKTEKDGNKSALWSLNIHDVTGISNQPGKRFEMFNEFHGSETGKNASISGDLLHCWRHNVSHNALSYLAVVSGVSTCSKAGYPHGGGHSEIDFDEPEVCFKIWKYAKEHGYIPENDPMPSKAMIYYALQHKICDESDVIEGWKLPTAVYNNVVKKCNEDGINPGRKSIKKIANALQETISNPLQIAQALQNHVAIHYDSARNYWMWNEDFCKYERIDETEIMCQISDSMDLTVYQSKIKQEILESVKITGRQRRVKDTKPEWIQFSNGVIDINTGAQFKATPEYFFASPIPHKLGNSEDTPIIDGLFKSWLNENTELLYEICAYCLYDEYPIQRIFAFIGSGSNGKGQFMTLLQRLIGSENCVGTDLDRLIQSRFEISKLYHKKAAFIAETNFNTLTNTTTLKQLSGGDLVSGEFKGKDAFDFVNTAKIILATNGLPVTTDRSNGFYRRWCTIEFKNTFTDGKSIVSTIPEVEYQNLCRKCIRILRDILAQERLPHEPDADKRRENYERLSNPVQAFIDEMCEKDEDSHVPLWYLHNAYEEYREIRGHRKITQPEFATTLKTLGFEIDKQKWYNASEASKFSDNSVTGGKNWKTVLNLTLSSSHSSHSSVVSTQSSYKENRVETTLETLETLESSPKIYTVSTDDSESIPPSKETVEQYKNSLVKFVSTHYKGQKVTFTEVAFDFCKTPAGKKAFNDVGLDQIKSDIVKIIEENSNVVVVSNAADACEMLGIKSEVV